MSKIAKLATALAAVAVATLGLATTPAGAGVFTVYVTGEAVCAVPTGHPEYQLNWSVENANDFEIVIGSAVESGAWAGNVTITPNPLAAFATGTGSDGPVPGDTAGTVTLTVNWSVVGGPSGVATGDISLNGDCLLPGTTTTAAPTTTAAAPATLTPAFTG